MMKGFFAISVHLLCLARRPASPRLSEDQAIRPDVALDPRRALPGSDGAAARRHR
jgi:hypothetical protein